MRDWLFALVNMQQSCIAHTHSSLSSFFAPSVTAEILEEEQKMRRRWMPAVCAPPSLLMLVSVCSASSPFRHTHTHCFVVWFWQHWAADATVALCFGFGRFGGACACGGVHVAACLVVGMVLEFLVALAAVGEVPPLWWCGSWVFIAL